MNSLVWMCMHTLQPFKPYQKGQDVSRTISTGSSSASFAPCRCVSACMCARLHVSDIFIFKVPLLHFRTPVVLHLVKAQTLHVWSAACVSSAQLRRRQRTVIAVVARSGNYAKKDHDTDRQKLPHCPVQLWRHSTTPRTQFCCVHRNVRLWF